MVARYQSFKTLVETTVIDADSILNEPLVARVVSEQAVALALFVAPLADLVAVKVLLVRRLKQVQTHFLEEHSSRVRVAARYEDAFLVHQKIELGRLN